MRSNPVPRRPVQRTDIGPLRPPDEEKTMPRVPTTLTALLMLSLLPALPSRSFAAQYHYGFDNDDKDQLGWALVDGGHNSSSSLDDLNDVKDRFGDHFL